MGSANEGRQARMIEEMRGFIRKVLADPSIPQTCLEIARKHRRAPNARKLVASEISSRTMIRIPEEMSEADRMFIDLLFEAMDDDSAMY